MNKERLQAFGKDIYDLMIKHNLTFGEALQYLQASLYAIGKCAEEELMKKGEVDKFNERKM